MQTPVATDSVAPVDFACRRPANLRCCGPYSEHTAATLEGFLSVEQNGTYE